MKYFIIIYSYCLFIYSIVNAFKSLPISSIKYSSHLQLFPEIIAALALTTTTTTNIGPLGNIDAAIQAMLNDRNTILCTIDLQNADEFHDSCQLTKNVVRYRGGKVLTFKQDWGSSSSTGAAIWNGANIASKYLENTLDKDQLRGKSVIELGKHI